MSLTTWLLFVATVFFVSATPGPNMLLAMTQAIQHGWRRTVATCFGLLVGLALIMAGSVAGLGAIMATSALLFSVLKYAGAAYLIYLGIRSWRAPPMRVDAGGKSLIAPSAAARFRTGFLVSLSNPKALVFFTALFPQFIDAQASEAPQLAIMAGTFFVIEASWQVVYAGGGARLAGWLSSPRRQRLVNRCGGGAFIGAGVLLSTVSRP